MNGKIKRKVEQDGSIRLHEAVSDSVYMRGEGLESQTLTEYAVFLKQNIESLYQSLNTLYNKLDNIAFWDAQDKADAAPAALSWSNLSVVTITNSIGASAVVKRGGVAVSGNISVSTGDSLTLTIEPAEGYTLSSVTATVNGSSVQLSESSGVYTLSIESVNADTAIVISGTAGSANAVTYELTHLTKTSGPTSINAGSGGTIVIAAQSGHILPLAVQVSGATLSSYNKTTGTIVISNATGAVTVHADAICVDYQLVKGIALGDFSTRNCCITQYSGMGRATPLLLRSGLVNPFTWIVGGDHVNTTANSTYSAIPIPYGATKIRVTLTNTDYKLSTCICGSDGVNKKTTEWDSAQAAAREYTLSFYSGATHLEVNFMKVDSGDFTDETFESLGFTLEFV